MTLSRTDLQDQILQKLAAARNGPPPLSPEALDASLDAILSRHPLGQDAWVFGYGSLIWNPLFHFNAREHAVLHGYHRRFCLRSELGRGSPGRPGLVLGLERGGSCRGLAFRIAAHHLRDELRLLWTREMVTGAYSPRWVDLRSQTGRRLRAIAFVMNRDYPNYAGGLSIEETAQTLASARGELGSCAEYLFRTHDSLLEIGVRDRYLSTLARSVREMLGPSDSGPPTADRTPPQRD
ncbi:MAG: gamma-glutamylcyclotransferase [Burkholderiaceae bacterium]